MASTNLRSGLSTSTVDPNNGFCSKIKIFNSLRPQVPLPPPFQPISITEYALSLLPPTSSATYLVDAASGRSVTYPHFLRQANSLALHLKARFPSLCKGDVAFILLPSSFSVPVIYFSLLSLGVVISPANPLGSDSEIGHQVRLSRPAIAFATSATSHKLPKLRLGTILVDSPEFISALSQSGTSTSPVLNNVNRVTQSDSATILYSSGTTGRVMGVLMTHRNMIAVLAAFFHNRSPNDLQAELVHVTLFTLPLYHIFGLFMLLKGFVYGETLVMLERFEFQAMLRAVEKYRVSGMPVSPPIVVMLVKSQLTDQYDLRSLQTLSCGGAPLGKDISEQFKVKFPHVELVQGYAMTESGGGARMIGPDETKRYGSVGRLGKNLEARIVDPISGEALLPGQKGELWLRGPCIMKGYIGDDKATAETLSSDGWLRTGDLCYFDSEGFLYIVDRLKELIKYKGYQVPPVELENLLQSHAQISDAAVIPYPDEEAGQIPMTFVVRKPGSNVSESQVMDFISKQVSPHKKIRRVAFIDSIPKSPAGKILRRHLTDIAVTNCSAKL